MKRRIMRMIKPCWRGSAADGDEPAGRGGEASGRIEGLLWHKELGYHAWGAFSMAVIQANSTLEDQSRLESGFLGSNKSGPQGTFVGIYDGHGGAEASRYVNENLFGNLQRIATEHRSMSEHVIRKSFLATEEGFLSVVKRQWQTKPHIASAGTCCLVGVVCNGILYTANVGDSRLVLGKLERATKEVIAIQLSSEHNASLESVRQELKATHPHDPQIVVMKHKVWRVKGLIQVTKTIGDAYLKRAEFNKEPLLPKFRLPDPEPFLKPILSPDPSISVLKLLPEDQFLIFASDGLWEHLSNQEAVDIVSSNPRKGIARKLIEAALQDAAKKREVRFADLKKIERGVRRHFHDDISVVVVFLDQALIKGGNPRKTNVSITPSF